MSAHDENNGPHVATGVRSGAQVIAALFKAAIHGNDTLRDVTAALTDDQARWGLACIAWWDAAAVAGVRCEVDDPVCERLRDCGESFAAIHAAVSAVTDVAAIKAALSNLALAHYEARTVARAAMAASN